MSELDQSPIEGTVVEHGVAERTVAFFIALGDEKVDKDWAEIGKTMLLVTPAVVALVATRGKKFRKVRELIAPGIALGKLVKDVSAQITPEHLAKADKVVAEAKVSANTLVSQARARTRRVS